MTDTRKKASQGDYIDEQRVNDYCYQYYYNQERFFAKPEYTYLPGDGIVGAHISYRDLANNPIDIDSALRGIRSCDMVNTPFSAVADLKNIQSLNMYQKHKLQMPDPLIIERNQRPKW
jgi:hypothetical protein